MRDAWSASARWCSFRPKAGMHGCLTPQINLLRGSLAMETQSPSTWRKPTLTSPSAGKVTTALKVAPSCTQTETRGASLQSLAIPPPKLHNWLNRKLVSRPAAKRQIRPLAFRTKSQKLLQVDSRSEERAKRCQTQNTVTFPARSEACSREKRNKWQGPASGGKDAVYVGFDLEQA